MDEARKAMIAKRFGGNASGARTGGEGTARRKNKGSMKSSGGIFLFAYYLYFVFNIHHLIYNYSNSILIIHLNSKFL